MGKKVKCVVWDLDNTIWEGILSEDREVRLKPGIKGIIETLDDRGILQSIASKNDYDDAMKKLREFGLEEYFLYPQISWNSKAESVRKIAESINIGIDTLAFVDDQITEREEVSFSHPEVLT
ncbi:MAG TPA: HAD-IIIC family phosphatase, partial [Clostridia bacterium]